MGGYQVSPACFGYMTRQLMDLAGGRVIMALEGGYDLPSICDASYECVKALLGDETTAIRPEELARRPCQNAVESLHKIISIQVSLEKVFCASQLIGISFFFVYSNLIGLLSSDTLLQPACPPTSTKRLSVAVATEPGAVQQRPLQKAARIARPFRPWRVYRCAVPTAAKAWRKAPKVSRF